MSTTDEHTGADTLAPINETFGTDGSYLNSCRRPILQPGNRLRHALYPSSKREAKQRSSNIKRHFDPWRHLTRLHNIMEGRFAAIYFGGEVPVLTQRHRLRTTSNQRGESS